MPLLNELLAAAAPSSDVRRSLAADLAAPAVSIRQYFFTQTV
jgi:hypothetical protein